MKKTPRNPLYTLAALTLFIALFFVVPAAYRYGHQKPAATESKLEHVSVQDIHIKERAYWKEQIQKLGAPTAFKELLKATATSSESVQHLKGHVFGRALYETEGLAGFSVCGNELGGGCTHEFFARAIQDNGEGAASTLNSECLRDFGANPAVICQHGLGHGLLGYFGYEESGLQHALETCAALNTKDPIKGCFGGAFMEYNSYTMVGWPPRPEPAEGYFSECSALADTFKPACYFWAIKWIWESKYKAGNAIQVFTDLGSNCEQSPKKYTDSCFRGIGYIAPPRVGFDATKSRDICNAVSKVQYERDVCWQEASLTVH